MLITKATNAIAIVATYNKMWVEVIEIARNNNSDKHCIRATNVNVFIIRKKKDN